MCERIYVAGWPGIDECVCYAHTFFLLCDNILVIHYICVSHYFIYPKFAKAIISSCVCVRVRARFAFEYFKQNNNKYKIQAVFGYVHCMGHIVLYRIIHSLYK